MEEGDEGGDGGGEVAGIGDLVGADGFGEGDDKAEEVGGGGGVVEAAEVVGGVDAFCWWGLEVVRGERVGTFWDLGIGARIMDC